MIGTQWQDIAPISAKRANEARREAHNALHWMARIANSYRPAEDDNRHVLLQWHDEAGVLRTKPFGDNVTVELRLACLELQFCENGVPVPHVLSFEERTPAHVEAWVLVELLHRGIDRDRFSKVLPYPAEDLMLGDHREHEVEAYVDELSALNGWMRNAATVLAALRHELAADTGGDYRNEEIVCWPETFQLGLDLPLGKGGGAESLRAGLSAGDGLRPHPFFFVGAKEQAYSGDFAAGSILSVHRIATDNLAAADVIAFLRREVRTHRKRLAS